MFEQIMLNIPQLITCMQNSALPLISDIDKLYIDYSFELEMGNVTCSFMFP